MSGTHHHRKKEKVGKVSSSFKKVRSRRRKAKEKQAIKDKDYDNIPTFKKSDEYDFW